MIPSALLFSRYRAFRDVTQLELAPLTIIIGKNGGGKSILTRLPLLLASGLAPEADAPLDLNAGGISHSARYEDLIFERSAQPFSLGAEITENERKLRFVTTLRHIAERHELGVEAFELFEDGQLVVRLRAARPEEIGYPTGTFIVESRYHAGEVESKVTLVGLFPTQILADANLSATICGLREMFGKAFNRPSYLGPFRSEAGSLPRIPRQGVRHLGPRGEHALDILGNDGLRGDGDLVRQVEDWFESAMGGNRVKLDRAGDLPRLLVHDSVRNIDVDVCDTGAGFAQVFPVVVQCFARRMGGIDGHFTIVEQPELHLHPAAHGGVADLIGDTAIMCRDESRFICETHSEEVVTRLRRRVAEARIPPDMVRIISVGHQSAMDEIPEPIRVLGIDTLGALDAWPVGVFDEAFDDLVLMREAVRRRLSQERDPTA